MEPIKKETPSGTAVYSSSGMWEITPLELLQKCATAQLAANLGYIYQPSETDYKSLKKSFDYWAQAYVCYNLKRLYDLINECQARQAPYAWVPDEKRENVFWVITNFRALKFDGPDDVDALEPPPLPKPNQVPGKTHNND